MYADTCLRLAVQRTSVEIAEYALPGVAVPCGHRQCLLSHLSTSLQFLPFLNKNKCMACFFIDLCRCITLVSSNGELARQRKCLRRMWHLAGYPFNIAKAHAETSELGAGDN